MSGGHLLECLFIAILWLHADYRLDDFTVLKKQHGWDRTDPEVAWCLRVYICQCTWPHNDGSVRDSVIVTGASVFLGRIGIGDEDSGTRMLWRAFVGIRASHGLISAHIAYVQSGRQKIQVC